jgi:hypothetical protein
MGYVSSIVKKALELGPLFLDVRNVPRLLAGVSASGSPGFLDAQ